MSKAEFMGSLARIWIHVRNIFKKENYQGYKSKPTKDNIQKDGLSLSTWDRSHGHCHDGI